jgi:hypothetical protein
MTADPRGDSVNEAVASQHEFQAQLYQYAEDTGHLRHLLHQGCHSAQEFLFAKPMVPDSTGVWIGQMGQGERGRYVA